MTLHKTREATFKASNLVFDVKWYLKTTLKNNNMHAYDIYENSGFILGFFYLQFTIHVYDFKYMKMT